MPAYKSDLQWQLQLQLSLLLPARFLGHRWVPLEHTASGLGDAEHLWWGSPPSPHMQAPALLTCKLEIVAYSCCLIERRDPISGIAVQQEVMCPPEEGIQLLA